MLTIWSWKKVTKKTMITLNTDKKQLMDEIRSDYPKALYWLEKQFGGEHKYDLEVARLLYMVRCTGKTQQSKIVEYHSKNGNRWITFIQAYKDENTGFVTHFRAVFCLYKTIGSVGAFFPYCYPTAINGEVIRGCLIFTSHFFLRASERIGLDCTNESCIIDFIARNSNMAFQLAEADECGKGHVDIKFSDGIGRGVIISRDPCIVEIRTCLSDTQLSSGQKRSTRHIACIQNIGFPPTSEEVIKAAFEDAATLHAAMEKERKKYLKQGGHEFYFNVIYLFRLIALQYLLFISDGWAILPSDAKGSCSAFDRLSFKYRMRIESPLSYTSAMKVLKAFTRDLCRIYGYKDFDEVHFENYCKTDTPFNQENWDCAYNS